MIEVKSEELKTKTPTNQRRPRLMLSGLSNWGPLCVGTIITLLLTPYLISSLGRRDYGIWTLVTSFIGYYGILRLGIAPGIMRYVPFYVGRNDRKAASEIVSTSLAMFFVVGLVIVLVSMMMAESIARFYGGGPKLAVLIRLTGLAAGIECTGRIFDAGLRAQEKWIASNLRMIIISVTYALGIAGCLYLDFGLRGMGYVVLGESIFSLILLTMIFIKLCPTIHLRVSLITLHRFRELVLFGLLTTVATLAYGLSLQGHRLIIGKLLSLEAVGVYSIAAALIERIRSIVAVPLQVFWPRFALLDGQNNHQEVNNLFRKATRFTGIFSSGLILLVLVAGPPFIRLWVGQGFESAYPVLIILAIGCLIESSLFVNSALLAATGHQAAQAIFAGIEGVLGITLSILLGRKIGLSGVAVGFTVGVALIRGLVCPWYVCRLLKVSAFRYYAECLIRPWLVLWFLAILAYSIRVPELMNNWVSWILYAMAIGCVYTLCAFAIAINGEEKKKVLSIIRQLPSYMLVSAGMKREHEI